MNTVEIFPQIELLSNIVTLFFFAAKIAATKPEAPPPTTITFIEIPPLEIIT